MVEQLPKSEGHEASRSLYAQCPELDGPLCGLRLWRAEAGRRPTLWRGTWNGKPALVKSYHHTPGWYRRSVGRVALEREWTALRLLKDSGRAPQPLARPAPWVVVMEWVEGTPLEDWTRGRCPADHLLREAEQLLAVLAQQRLVHADMGHDFWSPMGRECNLRITAEQRLVAIDFAGSLRRSPWPLWGGLADCLQQHDQLLLTKILYHFGDASTQDHPAWRYPSQLPPHWWELMRCLGKV